MATTTTPQTTDFSRDVLGRYLCNGLDEALQSADRNRIRPDGRRQIEARDFDLIIIGGGTFGAVVAEHLAFRDRAREHRILVLEGGPLAVGEHVQNMPLVGLGVPPPTSIAQLRSEQRFGPDRPRDEVWGLAWHSPIAFPGLAYCIGGRSVYWGGWSPELLAGEMAGPVWPAAVVQDLTTTPLPGGSQGYFQEASEQIGVDQTNDFVFGELHRALRRQVFEAVKAHKVAAAAPLADLPDHPTIRFAATMGAVDLARLLGLPSGESVPPGKEKDARNELKLEAPLAVQGQSGHAGFFPFNKFSAVPLLTKAAREAFAESLGDDVRKRLMVVPRCHVIRLNGVREGDRIRATEVVTNQGVVAVPADGKVIIALGTIESTRLVESWFRQAIPDRDSSTVGQNLMVHLRSNLDVRIPRQNLKYLSEKVHGLQASALFVKGIHKFKDGSGVGHYHLQITASGLGARGGNSEAELFKKVPDIDTFNAHRNANDTHVAITIRGIGEMQAQNPESFVALDPESDEDGEPRAFVAIADPRESGVRARNVRSARDFELWDVMDQAAMDVAKALGVTQPPKPIRDGLGTTHHETGTLAMGEATSTSPTMPDGRLRHSTNAYIVGPALLPTIGSPNPMLTGVALCRRLGDSLAASRPYTATDGFQILFDGLDVSKWRMTTIRNQPGRDNPGTMRIINGALETAPGNDMGIFWCTIPSPANFVLRLEWLRWAHGANSGVYVRFPDPDSRSYDNTAYVADDFGFEVQIDELGDAPIHRTGAIYRKDGRTDGETLTQRPARPAGDWNEYEIRVEEQVYTVKLNGEMVCVFDNANRYPDRGRPSAPNRPTFVGLQVYPNASSLVAFRRIRIQEI